MTFTTQKKNSHQIKRCSFSPDGSQIVTAARFWRTGISYTGTLALWDVASGIEVANLIGHTKQVAVCAFSPDGKRILSGADDSTLKLWNVSSQEEILTLRGHANRITACAFSPDGTKIASGSEEGDLKLWDAATGTLLVTFRGHTGRIVDCTFSQDSTKLVSGSWDGTIKLWEIPTVFGTSFVGHHTGAITAVRFSSDGTRIVSSSLDGTLKLWDPNMMENPVVSVEDEYSLRTCAISPDGTRVVSASHKIRLWNAKNGTDLGAFFGTVYLSRTKLLYKYLSRLFWFINRGVLNAITFIPILFVVLFVVLFVIPVLLFISGVSLLSGIIKKIPPVIYLVLLIGCVILGLNSSWISSGMVFRDIITSVQSAGFAASSYFHANFDRLMVGLRLTLIFAVLASLFMAWFYLISEGYIVSACTFSPDGEKIISGSHDGTLLLWDVASRKELCVFARHWDIGVHYFLRFGAVEGPLWRHRREHSYLYSPDGLHSQSTSFDRGTERSIDWDNFGAINACVFSQNGTRIISGCEDGSLRLWNAETGRLITTLRRLKGPVKACDFSLDGTRIVFGGGYPYDPGELKLWNVDKLKIVTDLVGHTDFVTSCVFSPDGLKIVSGSADRTIKMWDVAKGKLLGEYMAECAVLSVAWHPDGQILVAGDDRGSLLLLLLLRLENY